MEGEAEFGNGSRLIPYADASWVEDRAEAFTDNLGIRVAGQTIRVGQMELGSDVEIPIDVVRGEMTVVGGLGVILSHTDGGFTDPAFSRTRGRVELGVDYRLSDRTYLEFDSYYDGIGTSGFEGYGLSLGAEFSF